MRAGSVAVSRDLAMVATRVQIPAGAVLLGVAEDSTDIFSGSNTSNTPLIDRPSTKLFPNNPYVCVRVQPRTRKRQNSW